MISHRGGWLHEAIGRALHSLRAFLHSLFGTCIQPCQKWGKQLIVGYEHKQQPKYDDWFGVFAALVWNEHLTLSVGFADLGNAKPLKGIGIPNGLNLHHQAVMGVTYQF